MADTIEKRVETLERELTDLKRIVRETPATGNWIASFGSAKGDPGFEELIRLGRRYRDSLREQDDGDGGRGDAGS